MKQLSSEGRFEAGIDQIVAGKVWAFTAVLSNSSEIEAGLGIAIANEQGYYPVPLFWAHGSFGEMSAEADRLNEAEGLDDKTAARIVCSSMAKPKMCEDCKIKPVCPGSKICLDCAVEIVEAIEAGEY